MGNREDTLNALGRSGHGEPGSQSDGSNPPLLPDQRKFRAVLAFVFAALLAGAALLPLDPQPFLSLQTCAFKGVTGLPCPLCGGTRAAQAVLRGDLARASYLNIAALPAVAAVVVCAILLAFEALRGRGIVNWRALLQRLQPLLPILVALFCFYWVVHLAGAVRESKPELVDVRNPIARSICQRFSGQER